MTVIQRAERFPVVARILWRARSQGDWSEGMSINASRSGVFFRADRLLAVGTEVELIFALSWDTPNPLDIADINCVGQIVRTEEGYPGGPAIVSTITSYSFLKLP